MVDRQSVLAEADDEVRIVEVLPEHGERHEDTGQDTDEDREERLFDSEGQEHDRRDDDDDDDGHGHQGLGLEQGGDDDPVDGHPDDLTLVAHPRIEIVWGEQVAEAGFGFFGDFIGKGAQSLRQPHTEAVPASFRNRQIGSGLPTGPRGAVGRAGDPGRVRTEIRCRTVGRNLGTDRPVTDRTGRGRSGSGDAGSRLGAGVSLSAGADGGEKFVAQLFGPLLRQILQGDVRVGAAGDVEDEFGHAEQSRQQLLLQVDGLHAVESGLAQLLRQQSAPIVDRFGVDAIAHDSPRQPAEESGEQEDEDDSADDSEDHQRMGAQPFGEGEVDGTAGREVFDGALEEVLQTVGRGDEDTDENAEALENRRQRMDAVPDLRCGRLGAGVRVVGRGFVAHGHSPARLAWPSPARLSRRRSASARGRPGIVASVAAEAVWSLTVARPNMRSMGPASTSTNWSRP